MKIAAAKIVVLVINHQNNGWPRVKKESLVNRNKDSMRDVPKKINITQGTKYQEDSIIHIGDWVVAMTKAKYTISSQVVNTAKLVTFEVNVVKQVRFPPNIVIINDRKPRGRCRKQHRGQHNYSHDNRESSYHDTRLKQRSGIQQPR